MALSYSRTWPVALCCCASMATAQKAPPKLGKGERGPSVPGPGGWEAFLQPRRYRLGIIPPPGPQGCRRIPEDPRRPGIHRRAGRGPRGTRWAYRPQCLRSASAGLQGPDTPATTPGANPSKPAEYDYWDHVDYIVDEANRNGIYVGLLPTGARWVVKNPRQDRNDLHHSIGADLWRVSREAIRQEGHHLDSRRRSSAPKESRTFGARWPRGIAIGVSGKEDYDAVLMSYHPRGGGTSSASFHNDAWLGLWHAADRPWTRRYRTVVGQKSPRTIRWTPPKPVIDAEPLYEETTRFAFSRQPERLQPSTPTSAIARARLLGSLLLRRLRPHRTATTPSGSRCTPPGRKPINGPLMYWVRGGLIDPARARCATCAI